MKSMRRKVVAMLLTLSMLTTMFPVSMLANGTSTDGTQTWQISKSKTATKLDDNYQSEVTLSLPAAQEQLESDVVFVLDKSTSAELEQQALDMLGKLNTQIKDTGAKVNVGVVIFNKQANSVLGLTELNDDNMDTIESAIKTEISSGTNTHAGLLAGKAMLDADTDVDANRKYLVFVSDGITYMYNETPTVTAWSFYADAWNIWAGPDNWYSKYGTNEAPDNWDKWMSDIGQQVAEQGTTYEYSYGGTAITSTPQDDNWKTAYAMSIDKALYLTNQLYNEMETQGYHCYAMKASTNANHQWASSFMNYLADGEQVSFDNIRNDIYYLLDKGSTVDDYMGYVDGEDGYNFDFVVNEDLSNLYMTIERLNVDGTSAEPVILNAQSTFDNKYGFGECRDGIYDYELEYIPADDGSEHFTWTTNVPLTNFERVQLHYTVKLMNPKTTPGTYGEYDADGSLGTSGLFTNNEAKLTAVDSNNNRIVEYFAKPTVSYEVKKAETLTITPADVTIYMGGETYEGAIGDNGNELGKTRGFPEPGFIIEGVSDFDPSEAILKYQDLDHNISREWQIVPYDGVEDAKHGIYRFEPCGENDKTPVRMQFTLEGKPVLTDNVEDFNELLYQDLTMEVYGQGIDAQAVTLEYKDKSYLIDARTGTLKVRGTENTDPVSLANDSIQEDKAGIMAKEGTTYAINGKEVIVADTSGIGLLFDDIIENNNVTGTSNTDLLVQKANEEIEELGAETDLTGSGTRYYECKYLDLVDHNNGNVWVAADNPVTIYWPLPEGTDKNTKFELLHFPGLHREMETSSVDGDIDECNVEKVTIKDVTETHVVFEVQPYNVDVGGNITGGFSPFVLVWENDSNDDGGNTPSTPVTPPDGDDTPDLNTEDHFSYIVGYPEDYRTGEPTDDEDLWPVKPQGNITRAEVATIFYRLLTDEARTENWTQDNSFTDVDKDDWFNTPVSTLSAMGIISGYEDGSFRPNAPITRAEFAAIAVRFFEEDSVIYEEGTFNDVVGGEWFANAVQAAKEHGIIGGYPDGSFQPNKSISRAEACSIVNRTLDRIPDEDHLLPVDDMRNWPDNLEGAWYYADMQEATNGHEYEWITDGDKTVEDWTGELPEIDWNEVERELCEAHGVPYND